jgi:hypothetical protein
MKLEIIPANERSTTLGKEIFQSRNLSDYRHLLERKAVTCALIGGSLNSNMPIPIQIKDENLRHVYYLARITKDPMSILEIAGDVGRIAKDCHQDALPALLTESPTPIWGEDDGKLLSFIEGMEELEAKHQIALCLGEEMDQVLRKKRGFDEKAYREALDGLPLEPLEDEG